MKVLLRFLLPSLPHPEVTAGSSDDTQGYPGLAPFTRELFHVRPYRSASLFSVVPEHLMCYQPSIDRNLKLIKVVMQVYVNECTPFTLLLPHICVHEYFNSGIFKLYINIENNVTSIHVHN